MSQKNRKLIEKSIEHWYDNLNAACAGEYESISLGPEACALCGEYCEMNCEGCPVMIETRAGACAFTPYQEVCQTLTCKKERVQEEVISAVVEEIHFLESLLDKE